MKQLTPWLLLLGLMLSITPMAQADHVILCGGPALRKWEDLRTKSDQHDRWWANFVRASTIQMDLIRRSRGPSAKIIWLVYRPGYVTRGREDRKPYTKWIAEQAQKRGATLQWINSGSEAIRAINRRPARSIESFYYFGHSNRHCFLIDYGNEIMAASKAWIHENDLSKISSRVFAPNALCQSYGCHTAESMSAYWRRSIGTPLIGVRGKTNYETVGQGKLPSVVGSWVR